MDQAVERTRALDGEGLEQVLRRGAAVLGTPAFLETVVAPLFERIGSEWYAGRLMVPHEHLATATAGPLVAQLGRALPVPARAPGLVVATPSGDRHEIGALLVAATAALEGWRVTYLGSDVPGGDIARAAVDTDAAAVAISTVWASDADALRAELAAVRRQLPPAVPVLVGGAATAWLNGRGEGLDMVFMTELSELRSFLRRGSGRGEAG